MTKRHQIKQLELDSFILLFLAAGIGIAFAFYNSHKPQVPTKMYLPVIQTQENLILTPTPLIPQPQATSQVSPDGTRKLTMTITTNEDLTKTYTFVTANADNSNQQKIYTANYTGDSMSIPFNTWSPDDKYVFLIYTTSSGTEALVMRADGQPFTDTEQNYNITSIFNSKNTGNAYHETTGWASETLLIINTLSQDGSKGFSYWLEIPGKALIQLSSQF